MHCTLRIKKSLQDLTNEDFWTYIPQKERGLESQEEFPGSCLDSGGCLHFGLNALILVSI